jgi:antitoxin PrlF
MITSKLTTKNQTTIPQPVRAALGLQPGDQVAYLIEGDRVLLVKETPTVFDDPFALFTEWDSEEDRKTFADL